MSLMYELIEIARGKSSFCLDILRTRFYSGKVKIVNTLEDDAENIEKGDIVVSKIDRLNPDWVPIMKMAGAIILDGGLPEPSIQSNVCRELRTPYISQACNATSVLHNDEEYLIDCETGIIYKVCLLRKKRLLFVCTGNTCRSPMAKVIMKETLKQRNLKDKISVESAGTFITGSEATPEAREVIKELYGKDLLLKHKPKQITADLDKFDLILTMTKSAKSQLPIEKAFTLKEYAGLQGDIQDPYGKDVDAYRLCRDEIRDCVNIVVNHIVES